MRLIWKIRTIPTETFGKVTARLGGRMRYVAIGRRFVLAWHVKEPTR